MQIALVIPTLSSGGAERVMSAMANHWAEKAWTVRIFTYSNEPSFYDLHPNVQHVSLDLMRPSNSFRESLTHNWIRVRTLRKALKEYSPNVVVSFITNMNVTCLIAVAGTGLPVIVSERIDPAGEDPGRSWALLRKALYPRAHQVVVQTAGAKAYFSSGLQSKVSVIPNMLDTGSNSQGVKRQRGDNVIVALGRLTHQKGFDILLRAFAVVAGRYPDWKLWIIGKGELDRDLTELAVRLGVEKKVEFLGVVKNPEDYLEQADLFVLSSRYEGFPNALCEALACGLPSIATDCPSGPREIIDDGVNGLLVPNESVAELAGAMDSLMGSEEKRRALGLAAVKIQSELSSDKIMPLWEHIMPDFHFEPGSAVKTEK